MRFFGRSLSLQRNSISAAAPSVAPVPLSTPPREVPEWERCLRNELNSFSPDGATSLWEALARNYTSLYEGWDGCPLSYRLGRRGTVSADSFGMINNNFTNAWDSREINPAQVAAVMIDVFPVLGQKASVMIDPKRVPRGRTRHRAKQNLRFNRQIQHTLATMP